MNVLTYTLNQKICAQAYKPQQGFFGPNNKASVFLHKNPMAWSSAIVAEFQMSN